MSLYVIETWGIDGPKLTSGLCLFISWLVPNNVTIYILANLYKYFLV